ncbi:lysozyme inhibitor LprI family protein [Lysobacter sp. BMK333-48F3]|uniref:lysozyme inhibitor LprI family protein n=1 Tax=Lysobacter sp. BMK333-48F3 TaxID=2867962 RepID=UPI001C8CA1EA|nr:lysozyme inhibitor LprI family protein [Lysobacter sp. BMK333-48F3]MBX9402120.1 lysozyme inhibitor LprI family protein [Lysobacter sp. BMK333-48F3]
MRLPTALLCLSLLAALPACDRVAAPAADAEQAAAKNDSAAGTAPAPSTASPASAPAADAAGSGPIRASFDCAAARSYGETTVCADAALAAKDRDLAEAWRELSERGLLDAEVRQAQRRWRGERDACTAPACVGSAYDQRLKALREIALQPDGDAAHRLDGRFLVESVGAGADWIELRFNAVDLAMDNERVIQVAGRDDPKVERAAGSIMSLQVEARSAEGKRLLAACAAGCSVDGVVEQAARGEWVLKRLRKVSPGAAPSAATAPIEVGVGDPRRAPLLAALKAVLAKDLGQPVTLRVDLLREQGGWAFASVRPRTADGQPIDFLRTRYAERQRDGLLDGDGTYALLAKRGGAWKVVQFDLGPTDVSWAAWPEEFGAPTAVVQVAAAD